MVVRRFDVYLISLDPTIGSPADMPAEIAVNAQEIGGLVDDLHVLVGHLAAGQFERPGLIGPGAKQYGVVPVRGAETRGG